MVEAVRPATADDLAVVAVLARAATEELRAQKGGIVWSRDAARQEPVEAALEAALAADDTLVLVGTIDDVVVGYAAVRVDILADGGRLARLTDLYVELAGREVGVGELLLDRAIEWAVARGCFGIDSLALPGDRATKNFFEAAGLVARAIVVHRPLP